jgi:hypothetical protein
MRMNLCVALGWSALLAGCGTTTTAPSERPAPVAERPGPGAERPALGAGAEQIILHVPGMTKRLDLA